jgi:hypothetical protein
LNIQLRFLAGIGGFLAIAAAGWPQTTETRIQESLYRLFAAIRSAEDKELERFLTPAEIPANERTETLRLLKEFKLHLRPPVERPMSELSAPLILVRFVQEEGMNRASACLTVYRAGSLIGLRLATYDILAVKAQPKAPNSEPAWRVVSIRNYGRCQSAFEALPDRPAV